MCVCATGLRRLRIPLLDRESSVECVFPRTLLHDAAVLQCPLQESMKQLQWARIVLGHVTLSLAEEARTAEAYMARIQREMMLTEDAAAYAFYADRVGAYVDTALFFKRSKRERIDVLAKACQEELLRTHVHSIALAHTRAGLRALWERLAGFHIVRWVRGCHARAVVKRRMLAVLRDAAARLIQATWRGYYARVYIYAPMRAARRTMAALVIQRVWRSWRARKPFLARKHVRRAYQRMQLACNVQAAWRGVLARREYARRRGALTAHAHPRVQALMTAAQQLRAHTEARKQEKAARLEGKGARAAFSLLTLPLDSLTTRLKRDMYKLGEAVSRQVTPYVAARSKVDGKGKWSRHGDVGTLGMLRRFAGREADLTNVYNIGLDVEYGVRLPLALAAKRRTIGLHDVEAATRAVAAASVHAAPSVSPFTKAAAGQHASHGSGRESPLARHPHLSPFPPRDELLASVDEPILQHERIHGMRMREWLTHAEIAATAARKAAWPGMTAQLEEDVAHSCAAGMVSAMIDVVTSYLQHLQVSQRRMEKDLAIATRHARAAARDPEATAVAQRVSHSPSKHADAKLSE